MCKAGTGGGVGTGPFANDLSFGSGGILLATYWDVPLNAWSRLLCHVEPSCGNEQLHWSWGVEALLLIYHFPRPRLLMQRLLLKARYSLSKHMAFFLQARRLLLLASLSVAVVTVFFQNTHDQKVFSKLTYSKQTYKQTTNYITKHIQQTAIKL